MNHWAFKLTQNHDPSSTHQAQGRLLLHHLDRLFDGLRLVASHLAALLEVAVTAAAAGLQLGKVGASGANESATG